MMDDKQKEWIRLVRTDRYFERFYELLAIDNCTAREAWESLEGSIFGADTEYWRYSSYESFRIGKMRYLRRLRLRGERILLQKLRKT